MLDTVDSKARKSKAAPKPMRACIKCGRSKELDGFYTNRDWEEQLGKDIWCKECAGKCTNKEEIKEYYWENHRDWDERIWQAACKKAEKMLLDNTMYQKSSEDRRKVILDRLAAQQVPLVSAPYYKYVDNSKSGCLSYAEAKAKGEVSNEADENEKVYDEFFNGYFTKRDLEYLKNYYERLEEDFTFDNENLRDYAKKCKELLRLAFVHEAFCRRRRCAETFWNFQQFRTGCGYHIIRIVAGHHLFDGKRQFFEFVKCHVVFDDSGQVCIAEMVHRIDSVSCFCG